MTLTIVLGAMMLAAIVGTVLGVTAALRGGGSSTAGTQSVGLLGFAIPGFLIAFGLISFFSIRLGWFPATGYVKPVRLDHRVGQVDHVPDHLPCHRPAWPASHCRSAAQSRTRSASTTCARCAAAGSFQPSGDLQARVAQRRRSGAGGHRRPVHRPARRRRDRRDGLHDARLSGKSPSTRRAPGDIPLVMGLVMVDRPLVVIVNLVIDLLTGWLNPKARVS